MAPRRTAALVLAVPLLLAAVPHRAPPADRSARWLAALPDGEAKRRFVRDCTGCHQFDDTRALAQGAPRDAESWRLAITRMLGYGGPRSAFPVISRDADPDATGRWLVAALGPRTEPFDGSLEAPGLREGRATVTEYDTPAAKDLPHDLAVEDDGGVVVTGMQSHRMYRLEPRSGAWETIEIPVPNANPRAIELDARGAWWVLLGGPGKVARYFPASATWTTWEIGMYPHSIALGDDGRVWFNGHFTQAPELLGSLVPSTGAVSTVEVPPHPVYADGDGGPVPYEQRLAPDGTVWMSELTGDRIVRHDPRTGTTRTWTLPTPVSGPRRFDIAPDGTLWIPAYAANLLVRFEPATERFTEIPLPVRDAVPYVVRMDSHRRLWVGLSAAERLLRYDPARDEWISYRLPTAGAMVRHLVPDARTGDIWLAYGASPGTHPSRIARVRPE